MSGKYNLIAIILLTVNRYFSLCMRKPLLRKNQSRGTTSHLRTHLQITYTVSMPKPATHLLEVEMRVRWAKMPHKTELKMPVWTPGSYLVREFARHVQDF